MRKVRRRADEAKRCVVAPGVVRHLEEFGVPRPRGCVEERTRSAHLLGWRVAQLVQGFLRQNPGPEGDIDYVLCAVASAFRRRRRAGTQGLHRALNQMGREYCLPRWMDHAEGKGRLALSHPYSLGLRDLKEIVALCEEKGWDVTISGKSEHFAGYTVKVELDTAPSPGRRGE